MRAFLKRQGLAVAEGLFLVCLAFVAYAHMRYTRAESVYMSHLSRTTFGPHIDTVGILNSYAAQASRWLMIQAIGTGAVLLASIFIIFQVWQRRTTRVRASTLATETIEE